MARVTYGAMITALTGSIGGITFQRNRSGAIARVRPGRTGRNTVFQQNQISIFNKYVQLYGQVSAANKLLWDAFAVLWTHDNFFGETKTLTGLNYYIMINYYRELVGQAVTAAPPTHAIPSVGTSAAVALAANSIQITITAPATVAGDTLLFYATPPLRSLNYLPRKSIRLVHQLADSAPGIYEIGPEWEAYFGLDVTDDLINSGASFLCGVSAVTDTSGIPCPFLIAS